MKLCASVLETTTQAVLARMRDVAATADLIEIRADAVLPGELDVAAVVERRPRPLVFTCRHAAEGGLWRGDEAARLALLERAAALGAEWIDVEWDRAPALRGVPAQRRVVSRHVMPGESAPPSLDELFASLQKSTAQVQKLVVPCDDARDALALLARAGRETRPTIALGLGLPGVATRLLAGRAGAPWTYAAADAEKPAAPGQLPLARAAALLRGRRVTKATRALGVIGHPVGHSRSPRVHNACFAALGIDAAYAWLDTQDPEGLLALAREDPGWIGFSVTIPHKERAARACDRVEGAAKAIGAVNTIARSSDGAWVGTNTDAPAAVEVLGRAVRASGLAAALEGLPVDLLGSGGAARACAHALREAGARVTVFARSEERGRALARELGVAFGGALDRAVANGAPRAVVNATSVGMAPDVGSSPVGDAAFDARTVAFDLVYVPETTRFLELARERGAFLVTGVEHFAQQAWLQLERFLGKHVARRITPDWLASRARAEETNP